MGSRHAPGARRVPAAAALVGLLAALPYLFGGVGRSFIFLDDDIYVSGNPHVREGLTIAAVRWALTSQHAGNWHPLTWLSHLADVSLFGLDARGHHLTSILLHALAAAALCLALNRLTGSLGRSALVAALFGVHPLHVESVAWIAERKDVLAGLLFALVLLAYGRYARRPGPRRYMAVAALLTLGLGAKPMLVTLPAVLLLLDYWPLGRAPRTGAAGAASVPARGWGPLVAEKLPLLALCVGAGFLTVLAQKAWGTITPLQTFTPDMRLGNALLSSASYLADTIWPAGLAVYYPHPLGRLPPLRVAAAALVLAALTWVAWSGRRRRPFVTTGWFWYLGMLAPVIGLVQVGSQARADRYTYLPLIGVFLMLVWWLPAPRLPRPSHWCAIAVASALLLLSGLSTAQIGHWRDSETLFRHALAATTDNWLIHNNLGSVLVARGRFDEAVEQFRASLRIKPSAETLNNLGSVFFRQGRLAEALEHYRLAARVRPDYAPSRYNLGLASAMLGRTDEAIAHYREALLLKPDFFDAALNLGRALQARGRYAQAAAAYRAALETRPDSADARAGLTAVTPR